MLARLVSFTAEVTRIAAGAFLNPIQDEVITIFANTQTLKGLQLDGTGSTVVAAIARTIKAWGGALTLTTDADDINITLPVGNKLVVNKQVQIQSVGLDCSGGITENTGSITTTAGNFIASGTPSGSAGPGIVQTSRLTSIGTKITTGEIGSLSGYGGAGSCTAVLGTDLACEIEITCDTTGAGASSPASFSFTFKNGTFTNKPQVMVALSQTTDATLLGAGASVRWTNTATAVAVYLARTPIHTKTYTFRIFTVGAPA